MPFDGGEAAEAAEPIRERGALEDQLVRIGRIVRLRSLPAPTWRIDSGLSSQVLLHLVHQIVDSDRIDKDYGQVIDLLQCGLDAG